MKTKTLSKISSILSSLICIIVGILLSTIVLFVTYSAVNAKGYIAAEGGPLKGTIWGLKKILTLGLSNPTYREQLNIASLALQRSGDILYYAMPLIMTGLSVAFAFKTGLFNIGAPGQYLMGGFMAIFSALVLKMPWYLSLIIGTIFGAIWGFIPGIFKAVFNINEVITCIMTNWIGLYLVIIMERKIKGVQSIGADSTRTQSITKASQILPRLGLDELFQNQNVTIGIFIAIFIAILMWFIIYKTKFGYELKACGLNKTAAKYAGINDKKNIVLAMVISGALAGLGGAMYYTVGGFGGAVYKTNEILESAGFEGISVALIAGSNPIGVIFSGLLIAFLKVGGDALQPVYDTEAIDVITSIIIYFTAFSLFIRNLFLKGRIKRDLEAANIKEKKPEKQEESLLMKEDK